jgi:hypothetical protein
MRKLEIELTEGMIRQKLLTVTDAIKARLLRRNEKLTILLPNERKLETDICQPGNRLRARGAFGEIYEQHQLKPGDRILLLEQPLGEPWVLRVQKSEKTRGEPFPMKEPSALQSTPDSKLHPSNSPAKTPPLT